MTVNFKPRTVNIREARVVVANINRGVAILVRADGQTFATVAAVLEIFGAPPTEAPTASTSAPTPTSVVIDNQSSESSSKVATESLVIILLGVVLVLISAVIATCVFFLQKQSRRHKKDIHWQTLGRQPSLQNEDLVTPSPFSKRKAWDPSKLDQKKDSQGSHHDSELIRRMIQMTDLRWDDQLELYRESEHLSGGAFELDRDAALTLWGGVSEPATPARPDTSYEDSIMPSPHVIPDKGSRLLGAVRSEAPSPESPTDNQPSRAIRILARGLSAVPVEEDSSDDDFDDGLPTEEKPITL